MQSYDSSKSLLQVNNLNISFKQSDGAKIKAVKNLNFHIDKGETLGLVGESGCGKSITSMSIMQLIPKKTGIIEGDIFLDGENLNTYSEKKMQKVRGDTASMIFQEPMTSLNPVHKIGKQISEVFELHSKSSKSENLKKTIEIIRKVGIPRPEQIVNEYPHQLSGGMRQRVMIAMAMAGSPKLLIADEPTTALDVTIQAQILDLMNNLRNEFNTSILLVTHDLGVIAEMADRVMVMYYGRIVEEADVRTIFKSPKHPYTKGLIQSIPDMNEEDEKRLIPIEGNVPNLGLIEEGCPFRFRCAKAHDKCIESPPVVEIDNQLVRCWLYAEEGEVEKECQKNI